MRTPFYYAVDLAQAFEHSIELLRLDKLITLDKSDFFVHPPEPEQ